MVRIVISRLCQGVETMTRLLTLWCLNHSFDRVKLEILKEVGKAITTLPATFSPHKAIKRVYEQRSQMIETGDGVDWATAEALAFGTLLVEGNHVRLSGQDVERGTFSHRHAVVHDQKNGQIYCPLHHVLRSQESEMFTVCNRWTNAKIHRHLTYIYIYIWHVCCL